MKIAICGYLGSGYTEVAKYKRRSHGESVEEIIQRISRNPADIFSCIRDARSRGFNMILNEVVATSSSVSATLVQNRNEKWSM